MVQKKHSTREVPSDLLDIVAEGGMDRIGEAIQILINTAMIAERQKYLRAEPHERTEERVSQANGFKRKRVKTRVGELEFQVPQTRDGEFYPSCLDKGVRSERALRLAVAEMYIQGVSTRKVAAITRELAGLDISSTTVSRAAAELDTVLSEWRNRPLGCYEYVFIDARYEKVRHGGSILHNGVLIAVGVNEEGKRDVLGVSVELSEAEIHWKKFLQQLKDRGLHGVKLITSDAHTGLKAALAAVFPMTPWQRCQVHLQRDAQKHVPKVGYRMEVVADIRAVFNAYDRDGADQLLERISQKWQRKAPRLAEWLRENIPEGLTVFDFPEKHQRRIRTSNPVERLNRELKRRTKVVSIFPNEASLLRLVSALLVEVSEDWQNLTSTFLYQISSAGWSA